MTKNAPVVVDFLYWEECPSHERALQMVHEVLAEQNVPAEVRVHEVESEEDVEAHQFPGSPTIRVQGEDIDPSPNLRPALTCRAYRHDNGKISPLPPRDKIAQALQRARLAS